MAGKKTYGLDIFRTLDAIDHRDMEFLSSLKPEERKSFHPSVVMRWVSSASGHAQDWYLCAVNERVNQHLFDIHQHPDLQYRLMASCGVGKHKHNWIGATPQAGSSKKEFIQQYYPNANELEISIILQHFSEPNNLAEFLIGTGIQHDEIKRIKKLFA